MSQKTIPSNLRGRGNLRPGKHLATVLAPNQATDLARPKLLQNLVIRGILPLGIGRHSMKNGTNAD